MDQPAIIELDSLMANLSGDKTILAELIDLFIDTSPAMLADIRSEFNAGKAVAMGKAAHKLKGSATNFGARQVVDLTYELENMGGENRMAGADRLIEQLSERLAEVTRALLTAKGDLTA
ncbi:MAG: Hpt domain-containing protein [Candidatus Marinimicrobia bacterium]|nr:Hpt domain-containing protein [Candidatus Neomarinimicrobiota bacterium]